jgi:hypothetical protein
VNSLKVLNALVLIGREALNQHGLRSDCCIGGTKTAIEVCRYFGIEASGLTVRAEIFNPEYVRFFDEVGRGPKNEEEEYEWRENGAWVCSIGDQNLPPIADGKWPGHLVMIASTEHGSHLIDLTIDQANRPHKNIELSSLHFLVPTEFALKESQFMIQNVENGCIVVYDSYPNNRTFAQAPDWGRARAKDRKPLVGQIIRTINKMPDRPELEEPPFRIPRLGGEQS